MARLRNVVALLSLIAVVGTASVALADALVVIEVRAGKDFAEGTVRLKAKSGGKTYECATSRGKCTLDGVTGGLYTVTMVPRNAKPPKPRTVMIPPSGRVELHVSLTK